jgi:hypothetical protein
MQAGGIATEGLSLVNDGVAAPHKPLADVSTIGAPRGSKSVSHSPPKCVTGNEINVPYRR